MTTPPAVLALSGWGYAELRLYGVLRSSLGAGRLRGVRFLGRPCAKGHEHHDRDAPVRSASLVANPARVHFQVSPPQPLPLLPLRFVSQHVAGHAPYTDRGPRVGSQIVAPARVAVLAPVRSDERDPLAVGYPQYR